MALAQKKISIVFDIKDEGVKRFVTITESMRDGLKKVSSTFTTVKKEGDKTTRTTEKYLNVQKTLGRRSGEAAAQISKMGRNLVFMGFIFNAVSRRVVRALKSIFNAFKNIIQEGANLDKQFEWLSKTVEALAFGGADLSQYMGDVMRVFQDGFTNAQALRMELADIDIHFKDIKNTILEHTIPALTGFNDTLDGLNWDSIKESLGNAVDNFLTPIMEAIDKLLDEEHIGKLMSDLETVAGLVGDFAAGFIEGIESVVSWVADLDDIIGDDDSGLKGIAKLAGSVTAKLGLIAIPAILVGGLTSMFGRTLTAAKTVVAGLAGAIGVSGVSGLLLALGGITAVGAAVVLHWEDTIKPALQDFGGAIDNLWNALTGGESAKEAWVTLMNVLKAATKPLADLIANLVEGLAWIINRAADITKALKGIGGKIGGGLSSLLGKQWGGLIPQTGLYMLHKGEYVQPVHGRGDRAPSSNITTVTNVILDGRTIARQVSRHMGKDVRSTLILP